MKRHTIAEIWQELETIKNNHLHHINDSIEHMKKDMDQLDRKIEKVDGKFDKMDTKLWWLLGILVTTVVVPSVVSFLQKFPG